LKAVRALRPFCRDLMAQELGLGVLIKLGMRVLTANGDDLTVTDDHMKVEMRQIAGTYAQLEKARLVAKLKAARDRKRAAHGKCEGRKGYTEAMPETVALAKQLQAGGLSYRKIAAELAVRGHVTGSGKPHRRVCNTEDATVRGDHWYANYGA
jgi:hypothetical protein